MKTLLLKYLNIILCTWAVLFIALAIIGLIQNTNTLTY